MSNLIEYYGCNNTKLLNFPVDFWIPISFSNLNSNCSNLLDLRNLQEQFKKIFCYQKLFWPFTVWINCSSDLKMFAISLKFQKFFSITRTIFSRSRSEQFWWRNTKIVKLFIFLGKHFFFLNWNVRLKTNFTKEDWNVVKIIWSACRDNEVGVVFWYL